MYTQAKKGNSENDKGKVTLDTLVKYKSEGQKFASLTAYDASFAALVDGAGVDVVLVGDSLGMVIQGHATTVPVSVDDMVYHGSLVARGIQRALFMIDMPFMSYPSPERALDNAARLMQEGGAEMVKLEGCANQLEIVGYLADRGVPVCAHIGLRPQSVHKIGGFKVQGREDESAQRMIDDAIALEQAGADIVLLECVPAKLAATITSKVKVPVIGIGAGPGVDGQILVLYDILDITPGKKPRFAKNFMAEAGNPRAAIEKFVADVKSGAYPQAEHAFK